MLDMIDQTGRDPCVHHEADALAAALAEVGQGSVGVRENLAVLEVQEVGEDGPHLLHCFF